MDIYRSAVIRRRKNDILTVPQSDLFLAHTMTHGDGDKRVLVNQLDDKSQSR